MTSLSARLGAIQQRMQAPWSLPICGKIMRVQGLTIEAVGLEAPIGMMCTIVMRDGRHLQAEVIGFHGERTFLMGGLDVQGLSTGDKVIATGQWSQIPVGEGVIGRVLDPSGQPLDDKGPLTRCHWVCAQGVPLNPLKRKPIQEPLDVGVKAINASLSIGVGQRMGLFAGTGVGKSVLMGMMARFTTADVVVIGLIGERGREVQEFIDYILGPEGLKKSVLVVAPADTAPLVRYQGAQTATRIAEYFRDQNKNVLLMMDSLTRFAQAQRELALAVGEPPATKGYPPSVFAKIPQIVERAGRSHLSRGSITGIYTVLTEGDDDQDPVADSARGVLDGHILLSRALAESGHYPAIDIERSISRVMMHLTSKEHQKMAQTLRRCLAKYHHNKDLITLGAYQKGQDAELDAIIAAMPSFERFLQQDPEEKVTWPASIAGLKQALEAIT